MITTASIIGTGNVASLLAVSLKEIGVQIDWVVGRNFQTAQTLANRVGAAVSTDLRSCIFSSQLLIISVSDNAYDEVISLINIPENTIIVHTSGSVAMIVFDKKAQNYGVFYPLQTFSADKQISLSQVPLCLEASSEEVYSELEALANRLSSIIYKINTDQRQQIHIAAIFACNFVNFLYFKAKELLQNNNIPFDLIHPLILETAQKAIAIGPENAQTGPAKRGDRSLIEKHGSTIEDPKMKELYLILSEQILNQYNS